MRTIQRLLGALVFIVVIGLLVLSAQSGAREIYRQEADAARDLAERYQVQAEDLSRELDEAREAIESYRRLLTELEPIAQGIARSGIENPWPIALQVYRSSQRYGVDPMLVVALGAAESDWRLTARGRHGEMGPMQVLPSTFSSLGGRNPSDWRENIELGVRYLAQMLERAGGDTRLAVAYYNAGPSRPARTVQRISARHVAKVMAIRTSL